MSTTGCDYSFARPSMAELKAVGVTFVMRYLTGQGKALTAAERDEILGAGLALGLVFEAGSGNASLGASQGAADGGVAKAAADALDAPDGVAIYFTVDEGVAMSSAIRDYARAFESSISPHMLGVYADGSILADAHDNSWAVWLWQTGSMAWPGGRYSQSDMYQGGPGLNGQVDMDTAITSCGLWQPVTAPTTYQGDKMQNIPIHIAALDGQGNGWEDVPGQAGKVVSVKFNGADPTQHGYIGIPRWSSLSVGTAERVVIEGGVPGGELDINVWVVTS